MRRRATRSTPQAQTTTTANFHAASSTRSRLSGSRAVRRVQRHSTGTSPIASAVAGELVGEVADLGRRLHQQLGAQAVGAPAAPGTNCPAGASAQEAPAQAVSARAVSAQEVGTGLARRATRGPCSRARSRMRRASSRPSARPARLAPGWTTKWAQLAPWAAPGRGTTRREASSRVRKRARYHGPDRPYRCPRAGDNETRASSRVRKKGASHGPDRPYRRPPCQPRHAPGWHNEPKRGMSV